jgi:Tol biopolymer transport system component
MSDDHIQPRRLIPRFSRFDSMVILVILALVIGIGLTVILGDRVGVQIIRTAPGDAASSTSRVVIQFNEVMDWDSVTQRVNFDPPVDGDYSWSGTTLRFLPKTALTPGSDYTVTLKADAQSVDGRKVLEDKVFTFTIRTPRVAYLMPANTAPQNVWVADPVDPSTAKQVTFSPSGILNFDVSPDGTKIAFAERNTSTGTSDIKMLDLENGALQQLTNCPDSDCNSPVWRPDGTMIAYHRIDLNSDLTDVGTSPTRVWLIDLSTTPATTRPLFSDSQILGYNPEWSADSKRVAVYDNNSQGILVYDFDDEGSTTLIPTRNGGSDISISPDGTKVVFPNLIIENASARSNLLMADLTTNEVTELSAAAEPLDDATSAWSPDGRYLAIARRYLDDRFTRTRQLYLMDIQDQSVVPLLMDERYFNGFFSWDPQGTSLVIQRFPELTEDNQPNNDGTPEIWTYELDTQTLVKVATNAYLPRWVP